MKLFLSYPHKDTDKAKALVKILTDSGQEVWLDEHLRTGPRWKDQLAENIRAADAIVLALTRRGLNRRTANGNLSRQQSRASR